MEKISEDDIQERSWTTILINGRFQLKLLSYFVVLFLITTGTLYSTTYLFFWNMKQKGIKVGIPDGHVYYQFLMNQKHDLDILFIGLAVLNFVILLFTGLIISHRIAGPLHKIKRFVQDPLKEPPLHLRPNDFFQDLIPALNSLKDKLK